MNNIVNSGGVLRGRPCGGVAALVKHNLRQLTATVMSADRLCIIKVADWLFFCSLYRPRAGSKERLDICNELLAETFTVVEQCTNCNSRIAGDLNCHLKSTDNVSFT